jgi:hypothetical protein
MKSRTTRQFWQMFDALPKDVQSQATSAFILWQADPRHNSLRFKRVEDRIPLYSVRVGLNYRAVGKREGEMIRWFWIGSHAAYDRLLQ